MKRRLIGQAINDKAMRDFEPTMMAQIDVFLEQIGEPLRLLRPLI